MNNTKNLNVLSFGGGQDSTAILVLLVLVAAFRNIWAAGKLLVVMSDTGNEHPATIKHTLWAARFCRDHGIEFHWLTADLPGLAKKAGVSLEDLVALGTVTGYHTEAWADLKTNYTRTSTCGSKSGFKKTCSINLKQRPFYRFLEVWVGEHYGLDHATKGANGRWSPVKALTAYAAAHGKIDVMIGFAAGEERRIPKNRKDWEGWKIAAINLVFPLIVTGLNRQACQRTIAEHGQPVPVPSNCMICPFLSEQELLLLHRERPADFTEWVGFEKAKISKWAAKGQPVEKNYGVYGRISLEDKLAKAELKFGHLSIEELRAYRFNHASCATQY